MQLSNAPGKLVLPFANAGAKNTIPTASQIGITAGAASLTDGFPPLTRTPIAAGGVPPSGLDMNGILYALSAALRWANAGGGYVYDGTFAADSNVGGYPKGARVLRSDGAGYWLNTIDGNTVDPESVTVNQAQIAGWVPDLTNGVAAVTMTSANVTLTPLQYGKPIIAISGELTANLNLIFPNLSGEWTVINNCTGAFTVTAKTAAGTGVALPSGGKTRIVWGDGANVYSAVNASDTPTEFDNSLLLATTEFVKRQGIQAAAVYGYNTTQTLPVSIIGAHTLLGAVSAGQVFTLPSLSSVPPGAVVELFNYGLASTISAGVGQVINQFTVSAQTMALPAGTNIRLVAESATVWNVQSGTAQLPSCPLFSLVNSTNGYQKLPSGLIIQWGAATIPAGSPGTLAITFPIAFPNGRVCGLVSPAVNPGGTIPGITLTSNTGGTLYAYNAS